MEPEIKQIIRQAVETLITDASSPTQIRKKHNLHINKIHFIPLKYRILGGILHALNIKFGNFIETLVALVIEHDQKVTALEESGKKLKLGITPDTNRLIEEFIRSRQLPDSSDLFDAEFVRLQEEIIRLETLATDEERQYITNDIDSLFQINETAQMIYLEIKYNDDHDTGKFESINRKFLKTYAGLISRFQVHEVDGLVPIIYYFNPSKRYSPQYTPSANILRGSQLFERYFQTRYGDIDRQLADISEDPDIIALFEDVQSRIWNYVDTRE